MKLELQPVLDALLDGVLVIDAEGRAQLANAEATRLLEVSSAALCGRTVERLPGGHALAPVVRSVLAGGGPTLENEQQLEVRPGAERLVDIGAAAILDAKGRPAGAVLLLRDRSVGSTLRAIWSERRRFEELGRVAAGIAHEVKNPLGGVRGMAELLATRSRDAKLRETAERIVREVDRIATLLEELTSFARSDALHLEPVNLHRVLDDVLALLAADPLGEHVRFERRFDPSLPELLADARRLQQVFLNLGRNALEAMGEGGGQLEVRTRLAFDHRLGAGGGGEPAPMLVVELEDSGGGIPESEIERVMLPFVTTKARGTGLGLALARHFVALHHGTLQLESRHGEGTTARVVLPLRRSP